MAVVLRLLQCHAACWLVWSSVSIQKETAQVILIEQIFICRMQIASRRNRSVFNSAASIVIISLSLQVLGWLEALQKMADDDG